MKQLNDIYKKNGIFILFIFLLGFSIPYIKDKPFVQFLAMVFALGLYIWNAYILIQVIKAVSSKQSSIHELKFLYITLGITCAAGYFYYGVMDAKELTISGLRAVKDYSHYELYTFDGAFEYFKDLFDTYLNSIYYSIVVMGTLGDSLIIVKGGFARFIVGFEVATALSITVFKVGEYFSDASSKETKASEDRIISEINRIKTGEFNSHLTGFLRRFYLWLKQAFG
ncbi:hypothetical protein NTH52_004972 [Vibrio harveyi]|nr:hypothetical protein [Vibrio harveyi]